MTFRRLRRRQIEEESTSNEEDNVKIESQEDEAGDTTVVSSDESEFSTSSEDVKKVKRSKSKKKPINSKKKVVDLEKPVNIKKKVVDLENLHTEDITVKKYSSYKLGNFKNRSMKVFTKDMDIYNMKYMEISVRYSERPKKKLCEFTGLPAMFTFPNSRLYYFDSSVYKHLKMLSSDLVTFIYGTKEICKNFDPFKNQY